MDQKLDRYRDALEAGTNPALIATWTAEVESARAAAETELAGLGPALPRPIENIPALIADIRQEWGTMAEALGAADGTRKGDLLSNLGVLVSYDPHTRRARVTCRPNVSESVVSEGGLEPPRPNRAPGPQPGASANSATPTWLSGSPGRRDTLARPPWAPNRAQ
jgi:site-specific DNA recombinase